MKKTKWGILGTGNIANSFTTALVNLPRASVHAVGSRSTENAQQFSQKFNIPKSYGSYEDLVYDPEVDIIYVSTPHPYHQENTLLALEAGKHVLCEKPLALNSQQINSMILSAKKNKRFLMEAMWMWFFPAIQETKRLIDIGEIGDVRLLTANFGFYKGFDPKHRLFNPALGGGALLDIGIYPLALAYFLLGKPTHWAGEAYLGKTGVDEQISLTLHYDGEKSAHLTSTIRANSDNEAIIHGTKGFIRIHREFWNPQKITIDLERGKNQQTINFPQTSNGMEFEAQHVMDCLEDGKIESDLMSFQVSRDLMEIMDDLRQSWGIVYPGE